MNRTYFLKENAGAVLFFAGPTLKRISHTILDGGPYINDECGSKC